MAYFNCKATYYRDVVDKGLTNFVEVLQKSNLVLSHIEFKEVQS